MPQGNFYVYGLKDPRIKPSSLFYIGKGLGSRAWHHLAKQDSTNKGRRIREIRAAGHTPEVAILADELDENAALKLEAELIIAFGTVKEGGMLTNQIVPSGKPNRKNTKLTTPDEVVARAQLGLNFVKDAVYELARANPQGISNSDVANHLGLQSDVEGNSINYLSYSILGILLREKKLKKSKRRSLTIYRCR